MHIWAPYHDCFSFKHEKIRSWWHCRYFASSTQRLASRLAYLREQGVDPPESPRALAKCSDAELTRWARSQLKLVGRKLGAAYDKAWLEGWLKSEEGQEWGYTPE